jgi:hypothetical protein
MDLFQYTYRYDTSAFLVQHRSYEHSSGKNGGRQPRQKLSLPTSDPPQMAHNKTLQTSLNAFIYTTYLYGQGCWGKFNFPHIPSPEWKRIVTYCSRVAKRLLAAALCGLTALGVLTAVEVELPPALTRFDSSTRSGGVSSGPGTSGEFSTGSLACTSNG